MWAAVNFITAGITGWNPGEMFALWPNRVVFHFLTEARDRAACTAILERALAPAGQVVISTFALYDPEQCSGLPVVCYDGTA